MHILEKAYNIFHHHSLIPHLRTESGMFGAFRKILSKSPSMYPGADRASDKSINFKVIKS